VLGMMVSRSDFYSVVALLGVQAHRCAAPAEVTAAASARTPPPGRRRRGRGT
jgi:hypothetical protein